MILSENLVLNSSTLDASETVAVSSIVVEVDLVVEELNGVRFVVVVIVAVDAVTLLFAVVTAVNMI